MPTLYDCLTLPDNHNWGGRVDTSCGPYYHHDHGAKVLGVAHLDTVMNRTPRLRDSVVIAPQLDDRLGVFCLLNLLPSMGITVDVLLTTGEERGRTTAANFYGSYNWIVELTGRERTLFSTSMATMTSGWIRGNRTVSPSAGVRSLISPICNWESARRTSA